MADDSPAFLARWSRRKSAARPAQPAPPPPDLPPVETLGPGSDFAAFLQQGVTAELQRQALAVAWRSDPVIAAFRGMADYDWDFNAPGYGKLRAADDVAKLLRAVLSPPLAEPDPASPCPHPTANEGSVRVSEQSPDLQLQAEATPVQLSGGSVEPITSSADPAVETASETEALPRRRHGSALPA